MTLDRAQHDPEGRAGLGIRPHARRKTAAGLEHAEGFGDGALGVRQMQKTESHDHGVEAAGLERQMFGVALAEFDAGIGRARERDLRRREIKADDVGAAPARRGRDIAGAGGNVERPRFPRARSAASSNAAQDCRVSTPKWR